MKNLHNNSFLSKSDVEFLTSKGFRQDDSKHSGYYTFEDSENVKTISLIPYEDGSYKLEIYESYIEEDGGWNTDFNKIFNEGKSLKEFINSWIV